jgi:hypothetical protein
MYSIRKSRTDRKSRSRGQFISITIHAILLMVLFMPFFSMKLPEEPSKEALVIQFDYPYNQYVAPQNFVDQNTDMSSKMSGSEAGGSAPSEEPRQSRPQQAAPTRLSSPTVTSVSRTSSALSSSISDIPLSTPKVVTHQAWQSVSDYNSFESDGVEEMKMTWSDVGFGDDVGTGIGTEGDDDSHISSDSFSAGTGGTGGTGGGTGNQIGNGSGPGGGTGSGGAGKNTGIGQNGNGLMIGEGIGGLDRKLIKRDKNVASLAVKAGKVSIFICVDKSGRVISSKYDLANSTIKDADFITKAEAIASSYIFAIAAPDAPVQQCGKLAFIFKIK